MFYFSFGLMVVGLGSCEGSRLAVGGSVRVMTEVVMLAMLIVRAGLLREQYN